jgi:hypothetical protein
MAMPCVVCSDFREQSAEHCFRVCSFFSVYILLPCWLWIGLNAASTDQHNQTKNQNEKMKAQEKFETIIETLNRLGCGEVEFRTRNCTGGRIEKEASLTVGPNFITIVFRPSGYLHPRTSCKVFAYVKGEKTNFDFWVRFVRSTFCA